MLDVKRTLNDEIREKEAVQKTAEDLRTTVKKNEGDKIELNRNLTDTRQRAAGMMLYYYDVPSTTLSQPQAEEAFENILGKGEIAGNQHFLLFPKCFLLFQKHNSSFGACLISPVLKAFIIDGSKVSFEWAKPHSSVSSAQNLKTGGRWFNP